MLSAFGQLGQTDRASLVGVQQALVGVCGPVQPGAQLLLGGSLPGGAGIGGGEAVELRQELVGSASRPMTWSHTTGSISSAFIWRLGQMLVRAITTQSLPWHR